MYKQIETQATANLSNGVEIRPVATLTDGAGVAHIWVDDHCYVLGLEKSFGGTTTIPMVVPVHHIFHEAMEVLRILPSLSNVPEHAPLSAEASVDHGVRVETTQEHENRAADRGCCVSPCSASDFDLRHHIYDTLILLGASPQIAELVKRSKDLNVTDADIDALRDYNGKLIDSIKGRLVNINKKSIKPKTK